MRYYLIKPPQFILQCFFFAIVTITSLSVFAQNNTDTCTVSLSGETVNVNCFGGSDGSIELYASGGIEPYDYFINKDFSKPLGDIINNLVKGSYNLTVRDAGNCLVSADFELAEPAYEEINLGSDIITFSNTEVSLNAGGNYARYLWSTGDTQQEIVYKKEVNKTTEELVSVEAYDDKGCTYTSTSIKIIIYEQADPIPEPEPDMDVGDL